MQSFLRLSIIAALFAIGGCSDPKPDQVDTTDQDLGALAALIREHVEAVSSENLAVIMAQQAEDTWYLGPDAPPIFGKTALEEAIGPLYEQYDLEVSMTTEDVRVIGDWAFEWGTFSSTMAPREPGDTLRNPDMKYFYLYQKQPDGTWKIAVTMYNNNAPPTPPS
jgi:ketosteroid isomerase-like protein